MKVPEKQNHELAPRRVVNSSLALPPGESLSLIRLANDCANEVQAELIALMREQEILRQSEARYRDFFENAKDAIYVHNLTGRFLMVNKAGEELLGYSREELFQVTVFDLVPASHLGLIGQRIKQKLADHAPTIYEVDVIRKDRTRVPVEVSSRLIYENGVPVGVQGTARDISERRNAELARYDSEERFRNLFENSRDTIFTCDLTGRFTSLNAAGEELTGFSREEAMTSNFTLVVAPEYRTVVETMLNRKAEGDVATSYELEIVTKIGSRVLVEVSSRTVFAGGQPVGVQGSVRDITARKRDEEALRKSEEQYRILFDSLRTSEVQLQQSQKLEAIGQLAGGVAHDFNNLLTAIGGYSDLTLRCLVEDDPLRSNLVEIKKATDRAASLTKQLLAFSRKQILEPKVLDLNAVVKDMSNMLGRLIGEDVELVTDLTSEIGKVKADLGQVEQILMNLVVNARDAMPHGGTVTIETKHVTLDEGYAIHHVPVQSGEYTMLAVSDTGMGMDKETQLHVFEPFFTTKSAGKGTGLGLSTVYGIVKQSGGYVWVYSEVGSGTVFKIYLPRVTGAGESERLQSASGWQLSGNETILLVEDEEIVRRMARMILENHGYTVLEATDGEDALRLCFENSAHIHLLLTDVIMPGMSGRLLTERIAAVCPTLPVLYMSGYTDDAIVRHGILEEDLFFLQKPFTRESLLGKVRESLNSVTVA